MPPSVCLPPLEFCRGVSPSQAAKSRPDLNTLGSGVEAVITEAISLPTPGTLASKRFISLRAMSGQAGRWGRRFALTMVNSLSFARWRPVSSEPAVSGGRRYRQRFRPYAVISPERSVPSYDPAFAVALAYPPQSLDQLGRGQRAS